jgi:branched-chain amino acid aminotransferase
VFANTAGNLCEGTGSNVFYVVDGELRTPTLASGCLAGISRALLLEWQGAREVDEPIEVLGRASEIFLVSTTRDVQAVRRCDGRDVRAPGPVTAECAAAWAIREAADLDP